MFKRDQVIALSLALALIFALSLLYPGDSILLLFGLFVFLGINSYIKKWSLKYRNSFTNEVLLALVLMVSMFFSIRPILHDQTAQATLVALALLSLGFKLIVFPVYGTDS